MSSAENGKRSKSLGHEVRLPPGTQTWALMLFLASLAMLFASSMVIYFIIRFYSPTSPALWTIPIPKSLWLSTAVLLVSSYTIHRAIEFVRRERQVAFRRYLLITTILGYLFLFVQVPSLMTLIERGREVQQGVEARLADHLSKGGQAIDFQSMPNIFMFIFTLIVLHALHVVGGLIPLTTTTVRAFRGRYDHEYYLGVKLCALYWHFLDVVWIVMFLSFLLIG